MNLSIGSDPFKSPRLNRISNITRVTTIAVNMLVASIENSNILEIDSEVVVSIMEHHANFIPWQELARRHGTKFKTIPLVTKR